MKVTISNMLAEDTMDQVYHLWNHEYPKQLSYADMSEFEAFLSSVEDKRHFTLFDEQEQLVGWCGTFTRDNERWFSILIASGSQGNGFGRLLLKEVMNQEPVLNGWVVDHHEDIKQDGGAYKSPLPFYQKMGFLILEEERYEKKDLSAVKVCWRSE